MKPTDKHYTRVTIRLENRLNHKLLSIPFDEFNEKLNLEPKFLSKNKMINELIRYALKDF